MARNYFNDLKRKSNGRFWINNPNDEEVRLAIAQGAENCTTNPAYVSKLFQSDKEYITSVIDGIIKEEGDIEKVAHLVYRTASKRLMDMFSPIYEKSGGTAGFVTMQDDPRADEDINSAIACIMKNRRLAKNYMAKIPVISIGIEAIEFCVEENIPICATEVFAVSQAVHICEKYEEAAVRTGNRPPFFVTHITGIYDEYLGKIVKRKNISISPEVLSQAGLTIARKEYKLLKERNYNVVMLGGGARRMEHLTGIMGGDAHVTVNWSTVQEVMDSDIEFGNNIGVATSESVIAELRAKLPDFAKAYDEDGLSLNEFAEFGPVQLFRNAFLKGWHQLLSEIAGRKGFHAL
jgi:transaldolase